MSVRDQNLSDADRLLNQEITIRRQIAVIDTLRADRWAHALVGAVIGGGIVLLARWQADPLIRLLDDLLAILGSPGRAQ